MIERLRGFMNAVQVMDPKLLETVTWDPGGIESEIDRVMAWLNQRFNVGFISKQTTAWSTTTTGWVVPEPANGVILTMNVPENSKVLLWYSIAMYCPTQALSVATALAWSLNGGAYTLITEGAVGQDIPAANVQLIYSGLQILQVAPGKGGSYSFQIQAFHTTVGPALATYATGSGWSTTIAALVLPLSMHGFDSIS